MELNPYDRAIFIAKNMNMILDGEYSVLILYPKYKFLNIEKYYGENGDEGSKDEETPGSIEMYGPQEKEVVDFVVNLVTTGKYHTEEDSEDFGKNKGIYVDEIYKKIVKRGRMEGQMFLQRIPQLNKDIRQLIGKLTTQ